MLHEETYANVASQLAYISKFKCWMIVTNVIVATYIVAISVIAYFAAALDNYTIEDIALIAFLAFCPYES